MTIRLASASTYGNAVSQLTNRQTELSEMQDRLSAGKKILRPSDDPTGAAQAERSQTRIARVAADQRALELQKNAVTSAESTLGDAVGAIQDFHSLVVQAGSPTLNATDRASIATQMQALRDQILGYANAKDSNGIALFGGLGSTGTPFTDSGTQVSFNGIGGQAATGENAVPGRLDGYSTFMNVPTGNGVFTTAQAPGTTGVWADGGQVNDPTAVTGHGYQVHFSVQNGTTTYDVVDTTTNTTLQAAQPYVSGQKIQFDGIAFAATGVPADGDALQLAPSTRSDIFAVLDQAIATVRNSGTNAQVSQGVAQSLMQLDAAQSRLSATRGGAGELLNQADNISSRQDTRTVQLKSDKSRAEDIDMVQALSDFQTKQTAYSAALGSYAQIQKLSLFNYIN